MGEKKVLLVEDERPITKAIATMLGANGLVVDVASTAEMALTQIASNGYDLVVIDASLPAVVRDSRTSHAFELTC